MALQRWVVLKMIESILGPWLILTSLKSAPQHIFRWSTGSHNIYYCKLHQIAKWFLKKWGSWPLPFPWLGTPSFFSEQYRLCVFRTCDWGLCEGLARFLCGTTLQIRANDSFFYVLSAGRGAGSGECQRSAPSRMDSGLMFLFCIVMHRHRLRICDLLKTDWNLHSFL